VCLGIPPFPIKKTKKIRRNFCSFASVLWMKNHNIICTSFVLCSVKTQHNT
jgi:hypothetical protein